MNTHDNKLYFFTIVDDFSKNIWTYLLELKYDVIHVIHHFLILVENQFKCSVKKIKTDNGGEFFNENCSSLFKEKGIRESSCPYTPQQNGLVVRKHRHLLEVARALRFKSNMFVCYWGECMLTACYLINLFSTVVLNGVSPYEKLTGKSPYVKHLKNFGCLCFPQSVEQL